MKKSFAGPMALLLVLGVALGHAAQPDTITQFSTIGALLAGAYDGQATLKEVLAHGDLGLGTFDRLDGEMVVLEGKIYQVTSDGRVVQPALTATTPYAKVVRFCPEITLAVEQATDMPGLEKLIDQAAPDRNKFAAVKIKGRFAAVKTRSVPAQHKPYPPLAQVAKQQSVFTLENVAGTLVGFRSPGFTREITVPGYHLHFLAAGGNSGGHVLSFTLTEGLVELDLCHRFLLILPEKPGALSGYDLSTDRSGDLPRVEQLPGPNAKTGGKR